MTMYADGDKLTFADGTEQKTAYAAANKDVGKQAVLIDFKSAGLGGGSSVVGNQTRDLSVAWNDLPGHVALSGNQITLQPGTYKVEGSAPAINANNHRCFLASAASPDAAFILGTSEFCSANQTGSRSFLLGRITLSAATAFVLRHRFAVAQVGSGLGSPTAVSGMSEMYSMLTITKEA